MRNSGISAWMLGIGLTMVIAFSSCIQLRKISLYDGEVQEAAIPRPDKISKVVGPILFTEDTIDMWGIVGDSCKSFALVDEVAYQGEKSLKLKWQREGCEWVGFGMGWDGYAGKDLTSLIDYAAFEMYVRSQEGKMYGLPMVFTLEDYSGVMSFCYTANKYFERTAIDEKWQRIVVPLKSFNDEGEGIDYTNIKQLQIEMQQAGAVYVDEIKLVFYEEPPQEAWLVEEKLPDPVALPQVLFDDDFANQNGWGIWKDDCQDISLTNETTYKGSSALKVQWDNTGDCHLIAFGSNWYKWNLIDISPIVDNASLRFFMKADKPGDLKFKINLEEFDAPGLISVDWNTSYAKEAKNGWYEVKIPLKDFEGNMNLDRTKHVAFRLEGKGEFYLDEMSLVE